MSLSIYYGRPVSANAFPGYRDEELRRDLESTSLDDATRARIEVELARRASARRARRAR